ncbi:hypothetical protein [Thiohalorhabdus sp.]|uniref:hypothetical protein n=1 Tax=Thiohalorhabdus sp. TaxID=3094134 RepID=UPI002FC3D09D
MPELFSQEWFQRFQQLWNQEVKLYKALAAVGFSSHIGYGFRAEEDPRGVLQVEQGEAIHAGAYGGESLNWDLRAAPDCWKAWMDNPPGLMDLGMAYSNHELEFRVGDYPTMIKNPRLAEPFLKSFVVMGHVGYDDG